MITRTIPYIPGDGVGPEVTASMRRILDAAVAKAYGGARRLDWLEVAAGQKAFDCLGTYLPDETLERCGFPRDEILSGLQSLCDAYGCDLSVLGF
jgi:isocitrate dehydrogenase